ncbi:FAD-binding monooxygenase [Luteibacter jiangsuensis]|uniref:FAD-binding monooxygenase n=1 Tax=Luteibacter jiangsuensis TaxID=637577 RepID=A0ABX0Q1W6_9GAMM|nr:FAD-dependent monooxygenase [Luteibacter jiangsuensis]NID04511.1 FAD-binding monooxygenase [Luteibacter jiangsuensis]
MQDRSRERVDVLIVGAGPVGLLMANECARRGLDFRIVEKRSRQSEHSKALAIFPRTMEILDMAGLVKPFLKAANRVTSIVVEERARTLAHVSFSPRESPYPFIAMVPQDVTERLLVDNLEARGGTVEYRTCFISASQQQGHVVVKLERDGVHEETSAAFVVGCDGARSTVRHGLDLGFDGGEYRDIFLLADIDIHGDLPVDRLHLCPHASGPLAIFPINAQRRRVVAMVDLMEGEAPSLELVQRLLDQRAPPGIQAVALHWSSYFRIHHRHVPSLRKGRIFVAGDAAHIHSPFGGQGMNTGLQDVWNLAWKLDLVLGGQGAECLLDSYDDERLPVIKRVIESTDRLTRTMGIRSRLAQALRGVVIRSVSRLTSFQHALVDRLSGLSIAYAGSPMVAGAGERYFDASLQGGTGIGRRFVLVLGNDSAPAVVQDAERLVASMRSVLELRVLPRPGMVLVRPDGYVAWSGHPRDAKAAWKAILTLLARQTNQAALQQAPRSDHAQHL